MPSANVLLKEGLSYTYPADGANTITFRQGIAVTVTGRELIDKLKTISCLAVEEHQDKPVTPLAKSKPTNGKAAASKPVPAPVPEPEPEEEPEVVDEPDEQADADEPEATDEEPLEETTEDAEPEPEPEPAKPAKGGNKGGKAKAK